MPYANSVEDRHKIWLKYEAMPTFPTAIQADAVSTYVYVKGSIFIRDIKRHDIE